MNVFQEGINNIQATYVSKRFNLDEKQLTQWYKLLKPLTDEAYLEAVDEWCATRDSLPAPSNILEIAGRMRPQDNSVAIPKNTKHCSACGNRGVVSQIEYDRVMNRDYEVLYACVCDAGAHYRDTGCFKTITKADWERGKRHKTFTTEGNTKPKETLSMERFAEQFSMI